MTDGPFAETKEVIGGYPVLEWATREAAVESALAFLRLHTEHWPSWEGECEVRPIDFLAPAEVLSAEVSHHIQYLAGAFVSRSLSKVAPDFDLSTMVFDSVVPRLGELPPHVLAEVVFRYRYFKELNKLPGRYVQFVNDLGSGPVRL